MGSKHSSDKKRAKLNKIKLNNLLENIKSKYIFQQILEILHKRKLLALFKLNKKSKKILNITNRDYELYSEIETEIEPDPYKFGKFININPEEKKY